MIRLGLWVLGKKITKTKCQFHHIISRIQTTNLLITADVDLCHLAKVGFIKFLHSKVILFALFSILYFWEESHYVQSSHKEWGAMLPLCLRLNTVSSKMHVHSEPLIMILFGNGVFADAMVKMRSY